MPKRNLEKHSDKIKNAKRGQRQALDEYRFDDRYPLSFTVTKEKSRKVLNFVNEEHVPDASWQAALRYCMDSKLSFDDSVDAIHGLFNKKWKNVARARMTPIYEKLKEGNVLLIPKRAGRTVTIKDRRDKEIIQEVVNHLVDDVVAKLEDEESGMRPEEDEEVPIGDGLLVQTFPLSNEDDAYVPVERRTNFKADFLLQQFKTETKSKVSNSKYFSSICKHCKNAVEIWDQSKKFRSDMATKHLRNCTTQSAKKAVKKLDAFIKSDCKNLTTLWTVEEMRSSGFVVSRCPFCPKRWLYRGHPDEFQLRRQYSLHWHKECPFVQEKRDLLKIEDLSKCKPLGYFRLPRSFSHTLKSEDRLGSLSCCYLIRRVDLDSSIHSRTSYFETVAYWGHAFHGLFDKKRILYIYGKCNHVNLHMKPKRGGRTVAIKDQRDKEITREVVDHLIVDVIAKKEKKETPLKQHKSTIIKKEFKNLGNSCYSSALLVALSNLPALIDQLSLYLNMWNERIQNGNFRLTTTESIQVARLNEFVNVLTIFRSSQIAPSTTRLHQLLADLNQAMNGHSQEDCHELLELIICDIMAICERLITSGSTAQLFDDFPLRFEVSRVVECVDCNNKSVTIEPVILHSGEMTDFSSPFWSCWKAWTEQELWNEEPLHFCAVCSKSVEAIRRARPISLPQILVVQYNLFKASFNISGHSKQTKKNGSECLLT